MIRAISEANSKSLGVSVAIFIVPSFSILIGRIRFFLENSSGINLIAVGSILIVFKSFIGTPNFELIVSDKIFLERNFLLVSSCNIV